MADGKVGGMGRVLVPPTPSDGTRSDDFRQSQAPAHSQAGGTQASYFSNLLADSPESLRIASRDARPGAPENLASRPDNSFQHHPDSRAQDEVTRGETSNAFREQEMGTTEESDASEGASLEDEVMPVGSWVGISASEGQTQPGPETQAAAKHLLRIGNTGSEGSFEDDSTSGELGRHVFSASSRSNVNDSRTDSETGKYNPGQGFLHPASASNRKPAESGSGAPSSSPDVARALVPSPSAKSKLPPVLEDVSAMDSPDKSKPNSPLSPSVLLRSSGELMLERDSRDEGPWQSTCLPIGGQPEPEESQNPNDKGAGVPAQRKRSPILDDSISSPPDGPPPKHRRKQPDSSLSSFSLPSVLSSKPRPEPSRVSSPSSANHTDNREFPAAAPPPRPSSAKKPGLAFVPNRGTVLMSKTPEGSKKKKSRDMFALPDELDDEEEGEVGARKEVTPRSSGSKRKKLGEERGLKTSSVAHTESDSGNGSGLLGGGKTFLEIAGEAGSSQTGEEFQYDPTQVEFGSLSNSQVIALNLAARGSTVKNQNPKFVSSPPSSVIAKSGYNKPTQAQQLSAEDLRLLLGTPTESNSKGSNEKAIKAQMMPKATGDVTIIDETIDEDDIIADLPATGVPPAAIDEDPISEDLAQTYVENPLPPSPIISPAPSKKRARSPVSKTAATHKEKEKEKGSRPRSGPRVVVNVVKKAVKGKGKARVVDSEEEEGEASEEEEMQETNYEVPPTPSKASRKAKARIAVPQASEGGEVTNYEEPSIDPRPVTPKKSPQKSKGKAKQVAVKEKAPTDVDSLCSDLPDISELISGLSGRVSAPGKATPGLGSSNPTTPRSSAKRKARISINVPAPKRARKSTSKAKEAAEEKEKAKTAKNVKAKGKEASSVKPVPKAKPKKAVATRNKGKGKAVAKPVEDVDDSSTEMDCDEDEEDPLTPVPDCSDDEDVQMEGPSGDPVVPPTPRRVNPGMDEIPILRCFAYWTDGCFYPGIVASLTTDKVAVELDDTYDIKVTLDHLRICQLKQGDIVYYTGSEEDSQMTGSPKKPTKLNKKPTAPLTPKKVVRVLRNDDPIEEQDLEHDDIVVTCCVDEDPTTPGIRHQRLMLEAISIPANTKKLDKVLADRKLSQEQVSVMNRLMEKQSGVGRRRSDLPGAGGSGSVPFANAMGSSRKRSVRDKSEWLPAPALVLPKSGSRNSGSPAGSHGSDIFAGLGILVTYSSSDKNEAGRNEADRKKLLMEKRVNEHGGTTIADVNELFVCDALKDEGSKQAQTAVTPGFRNSQLANLDAVVLVAEMPGRTFKWFMALALGIPCVSNKWLEDSLHRNQILDLSTYMIGSGDSKDLNCPSMGLQSTLASRARHDLVSIARTQHKLRLLPGASVVCVSSKTQTKLLNQQWISSMQTLLTAMGVTRIDVVSHLGSYDKDLLKRFDYVLLHDKHPEITSKAVGKVKVVDTEWVKQCLIAGRRLDAKRWGDR